MNERIPAHVIAVLGTSPAIITELLWWLIQKDRLRIVAVEIWTTTGGWEGRGNNGLHGTFWNKGGWAALANEVGESELPALPAAHPVIAAALPSAAREPWLRVVVPQRPDGTPLEDIRTEADANLLAEGLYDRLRTLRSELQGTCLVGSLAGGRKTMSAALQGAFEMHARPFDRLTHVLVDTRIESAPEMRDFLFPSVEIERQTGVPRDEQIEVYDIRFPFIRELLRSPRLVSAFESRSYAEVWEILRDLSRAELCAVLREDLSGQFSLLTVEVPGGQDVSIKLDPAQAELYAALTKAKDGDSVSYLEMDTWIKTNGWVEERAGGSARDPLGALRQRMKNLRAALGRLEELGLSAFSPQEQKLGRTKKMRIEAAKQVTIEEHRGWKRPIVFTRG